MSKTCIKLINGGPGLEGSRGDMGEMCCSDLFDLIEGLDDYEAWSSLIYDYQDECLKSLGIWE
jgi:hypothetical protein